MWEWDTRVRWLVGVLLAALLFGAGVQYGHWQHRQYRASLPQVIADNAVGEVFAAEEPEKCADNSGVIKVHIAGAVKNPGVYELPLGARINEALILAGMLPDANPNALNLAAVLSDAQQVIVPRQGEETDGPGMDMGPLYSGSTTPRLHTGQQGHKVNINTANQNELEKLPGIGPVLAQRILDYRQQKGPFRSIEDLQNVSGIGAKRYTDLKELVTVK